MAVAIFFLLTTSVLILNGMGQALYGFLYTLFPLLASLLRPGQICAAKVEIRATWAYLE
jgi:hypothetical protein